MYFIEKMIIDFSIIGFMIKISHNNNMPGKINFVEWKNVRNFASSFNRKKD